MLNTYDADEAPTLHERIDFTVALGGDGTLLWAANLFPHSMPLNQRSCSPVSFGDGTGVEAANAVSAQTVDGGVSIRAAKKEGHDFQKGIFVSWTACSIGNGGWSMSTPKSVRSKRGPLPVAFVVPASNAVSSTSCQHVAAVLISLAS